MLTIYDLKHNTMLYQPDFFGLINDFDRFSGVSFVGSFKIIERQLLPRFKQVDLVLGLEDQRTGQNLNQFFNVSRRVKELTSASESFLNRLEDGTLRLRFTKDQLFHTKYFIVENSDSFIIFNGSMNLTKKALTSNHEMLWMYAGQKDNPADQAIFAAHQKLFQRNFTEDSIDYVNRKLIVQIRGKDKQAITAIVTDQTLDQLQNSELHISPDDITKITNANQQSSERFELVPDTTARVIKAIYTPKGNKRRNQEQVRDQVKQLTFQSFTDHDTTETISADTLYPSPMWSYQEDKIIVKDSHGQLYHPLTFAINQVSRADVVNFINIIKSFKYNKIKDESHQALSAFMYLITAPLIWKIRQICRQSNYARSADQVPPFDGFNWAGNNW